MNILRKYRVLILTFFAFFFSSSSCLYDGEAFYDRFSINYSIRNDSPDEIYVYACAWRPEDTVLFKSPGFLTELCYRNNLKLNQLKSGEILDGIYMGTKNRKPEYANNEVVNTIFIYKKETLDRYTMQELSEKNIIDALYILKTQEIIDMDSVVRYPLEMNK